jgi:acetyl esterase/lipase
MRATICFLLLSLVLLAAPVVLAEDKVEIKGKADSVQKYIFKKTEQGTLAIHVHFPPGWTAKDQRPALVFFFGGGWTQGNIQQFLKQAEYLATRGMVTARAEYRIKSKHGTTPDKCVEDCKSAVRWLRQHAVQLGIDPKRIAAGGGSAGGHTAAATFTTKGLEAKGEDESISSKPNLLVLFNPVMNTTRFGDRMGSRAVAKQISPNDNLSKDVPPAILFFGTKDGLLDGAREFLSKAKEVGLVAELYTAEGVGHGFFNRSPWLERTLYQVDEFLAKHGYTEGQPKIKTAAQAKLELADKSPK